MGTLRNNAVELRGKNSCVIATIWKNKDETDFAIRRKVSNKILYLLLEATRVKKILISRSIARTLPKNSLDALLKTGVEVCIQDRTKKGRREKYDVEKLASLLCRKKIDMKRVSEDEKIPLRTLYYYRKKFSERARKLH
ncbi:MAG: hypothetical protein N3G76_02950 [Candidatus Micrarchaeota archaeon]|nr:hypothetical protein [Candidatus Micrarchaeota archaeon]